jgi:multidrug efflux system outer membrane protein
MNNLSPLHPPGRDPLRARLGAPWMAALRPGAISVACAALLAACSSPTPYQRPSVALPPTLGASAAATASGGALADPLPAPIAWESLYSDERLRVLIRTALERNHDLRMALARMEEARAVWGVQKADQLPNVGLNASRTNASTPPLVQGNQVAINTRRYDVGLSLLSFELDLWGRVASLTEAAKQNFQASEEDRRTIRMGLISDVANAYFSWLEASQRQGLGEQTERTRAEYLRLTQRKRDVGAASDLEVYTAESSLQSVRADLANLQRQTEQARNALALLVGGSWPDGLPAGLPIEVQNLDLPWGANLSSEVLLRRPDVQAAERRLQAAHANIHAARVAFLPRIQLTGLAGSASPTLGRLFEGNSQAWSFVPSLQQPIFDAGRTGSGVDLAQARENQAVVTYEKTLQLAFREVADLLVARDTLRQQLKAQESNLSSQRERLRLTQARQRQGAASMLEWLDAERDAYSAEQSVVSTRRQLLGTSAQLYKALGGGDA